MKNILLSVILISFLFSLESDEIGRYQLDTTTYMSKKGVVYIVETVLDTKTGKVVVRRKKKASSYKLPYKNRKGKTVYEE
tara:strand:- start:140 stop:379 length:240 start_codon:yes stop_codon:yes gene_type:complete